MNKRNIKAMMMSVGLAIFAMVVFIRIFVLFVGVEADLFGATNRVGANQRAFVKAIQQNEDALLYSDVFWSYWSRQTMHDLLTNPPSCGIHQGFSIWEPNNPQCEPSLLNLNKRLSNLLLARVRSWRQNPQVISTTNPSYAFFLGKQGSKAVIKGTAFQPIATDIGCTLKGLGLQQQYPEIFPSASFLSKPKGGECGRYYAKPSFSYELPINLDVFEEAQRLLPRVRQAISTCTQGDKEKIQSCAASAVRNIQSKYQWSINCARDIGVTEAFNVVADQYQACIDLPTVNCTCRLDPPKRIEVKEGDYFTMQFRGNRAQMKGFLLSRPFSGIDRVYLAESQTDIAPDELDYLVEYNDDGTFDEVFLDTFAIDYRPRSPDKKQWLYKFAANQVAFIDTNNYDEFVNKVPDCALPTQEAVKICIDTGKKLLVYDTGSKLLTPVDAVLKYAVQLPQP